MILGAAPGNSETLDEELGLVALPDGVGVGVAEDLWLLAEGVSEVTLLATVATVVGVGVAEGLGVFEGVLEGAGVLLPPGVGTSTVTPFSAQVFST